MESSANNIFKMNSFLVFLKILIFKQVIGKNVFFWVGVWFGAAKTNIQKTNFDNGNWCKLHF